jgi:short-subunit dehydrogenase
MGIGEFWREKVVLITGGSAGLGLHLVRAWAQSGARVIAVARSAEHLQASVQSLLARGLSVEAIVADVTQDNSVQALFEQVQSKHGRLDLLVNCVGVSTRGLALDVSPHEYQQLMELNFYSVVRCTRAARELLEASRGQVVNIGSLASKAAARYLGGYAPTKFAVAAYSQQLRYEWADRGVHVLLVCPGPIAREDGGRRYSDASRSSTVASQLPASAQAPGGGVRLPGIDPQQLAEWILRAAERRQPELVVPGKARWLFALAQLTPRLADWILLRKTS